MIDNNVLIPEEFYFHGEEINKFIHVQVPIALIKENVFREISDSAKLLYGLLLNRTGLSIKNGWIDEQNRTYIIYKIEKLMEDLGIGSTKAKKLFAELSNINGTGIGLIRKKRVANRPSRIYVLNFMEVYEYLKSLENEGVEQTIRYDDTQIQQRRNCDSPENIEDEKATSEQTHVNPTERRKSDEWKDAKESENNINNIYNNMRNNNHTNQCDLEKKQNEEKERRLMDEINFMRMMLKENIDYDYIVEDDRYDVQQLDDLIELMVEACVFPGSVVIKNQVMPKELVQEKFEKINMKTMEYVLSQLDNITSDISNPKRYILAVLFNAVNTSHNDIKLQVQHDMNQSDWGRETFGQKVQKL